LVGAIFSGIAAVIFAMAVFQKIYHLQDFLTEKHFQNLSKLLLIFALLYLYFTIAEYLTVGYTNWEEEAELLNILFYGEFAWMFWFFIIPGLLLPILIIVNPRTRTKNWIIFACLLINVGMWLKRYFIVIPTLSLPVVGLDVASYLPTWVEITITIAGFALFIFLYAMFSKIFPIVSIWEMIEYDTKKEEMGANRVTDTPESMKENRKIKDKSLA